MSKPESRFWSKVDTQHPSGCWLWVGAIGKGGYGNFGLSGKRSSPVTVRSHRYAYELLVGTIPAGLDLDHLCRNRACVNPAHLEPVTRRENLLRGDTLPARQVKQTHCKRGHELTKENLYLTKKGSRSCRECLRYLGRKHYWKKRGVRHDYLPDAEA